VKHADFHGRLLGFLAWLVGILRSVRW
jgi:hypothetical protein